ncbi:MAG: CBS domain-containing protein [Desulfosalsimonas sp.]|uniref:CBS domain-containing protein n=1 Tax=Desulfosalsimonas sp. TaxID=3073848 RepID=UPI0039707232
MKTAADILQEKRTQRLVSMPPGSLVIEVIRQMAIHNIGSMLIGKERRIAGIWTERDFLNNMLDPGFDPQRAVVEDCMHTDLTSVPPDTPSDRLEEMFLGLFVRHILVMEDNECIGLLSIGDVLRSGLLEKDRKIRELNRIASWEYYENWAWHRGRAERSGTRQEKK